MAGAKLELRRERESARGREEVPPSAQRKWGSLKFPEFFELVGTCGVPLNPQFRRLGQNRKMLFCGVTVILLYSAPEGCGWSGPRGSRRAANLQKRNSARVPTVAVASGDRQGAASHRPVRKPRRPPRRVKCGPTAFLFLSLRDAARMKRARMALRVCPESTLCRVDGLPWTPRAAYRLLLADLSGRGWSSEPLRSLRSASPLLPGLP